MTLDLAEHLRRRLRQGKPDAEYLRGCPILRAVPKPIVEEDDLVSASTWRVFTYHEEVPDHLVGSASALCVEYGVVGISIRLGLVTKHVPLLLTAGDVFHAGELPAPLAANVGAVAMSDCAVLHHLPTPSVEHLRHKYATLAELSSKQRERRRGRLAEHLLEYVLFDAASRFAHTLAWLAKTYPAFLPQCTQIDLGWLAGLDRTQVNRFLRNFEDRGLIRRERAGAGRPTVSVLDAKRLERFGRPINPL